MKASIVDNKEVYNPHSVKITFETQGEAEAFYCLFNYLPISFTINDMTNSDITKRIKYCIKSGSNDDFDYMHKWEEFLSTLNKHIKNLGGKYYEEKI